MESDKTLADPKQDLFVRYSDEINKAYERAVREALMMHKRAGNPIAIYRDGNVILIPPDKINIDE